MALSGNSASRIGYRLSKQVTIAAEEYDDFGPLRHFHSSRNQLHQLFAVIDYTGLPISVETGIGWEMTTASDNLIMKLILSKDLNWKAEYRYHDICPLMVIVFRSSLLRTSFLIAPFG